MPSVKLSGPTNSTLFTTCCGVAICDDQSTCPRCKQDVPGSVMFGQSWERWEMAKRNSPKSFYS